MSTIQNDDIVACLKLELMWVTGFQPMQHVLLILTVLKLCARKALQLVKSEVSNSNNHFSLTLSRL